MRVSRLCNGRSSCYSSPELHGVKILRHECVLHRRMDRMQRGALLQQLCSSSRLDEPNCSRRQLKLEKAERAGENSGDSARHCDHTTRLGRLLCLKRTDSSHATTILRSHILGSHILDWLSVNWIIVEIWLHRQAKDWIDGTDFASAGRG